MSLIICPGCNTTLMCPAGSSVVRCTCQMLLKVPSANPTSPPTNSISAQPQYAPPTVTGPVPLSYGNSGPPPQMNPAMRPPPPIQQLHIPCYECHNVLLIPMHISRVICPFCQSYMEISTMGPQQPLPPMAAAAAGGQAVSGQNCQTPTQDKKDEKKDVKPESDNSESSLTRKFKGLLKKKDKAYEKVGDDDGVELLDTKDGEIYKNINTSAVNNSTIN